MSFWDGNRETLSIRNGMSSHCSSDMNSRSSSYPDLLGKGKESLGLYRVVYIWGMNGPGFLEHGIVGDTKKFMLRELKFSLYYNKMFHYFITIYLVPKEDYGSKSFNLACLMYWLYSQSDM